MHSSGSHYNSVRMVDDGDELPPRPITALSCSAADTRGSAAEDEMSLEVSWAVMRVQVVACGSRCVGCRSGW